MLLVMQGNITRPEENGVHFALKQITPKAQFICNMFKLIKVYALNLLQEITKLGCSINRFFKRGSGHVMKNRHAKRFIKYARI